MLLKELDDDGEHGDQKAAWQDEVIKNADPDGSIHDVAASWGAMERTHGEQGQTKRVEPRQPAHAPPPWKLSRQTAGGSDKAEWEPSDSSGEEDDPTRIRLDGRLPCADKIRWRPAWHIVRVMCSGG